ncbi:MAG: PQQ-dependent dehydrogenase, methanol/ethanol family [Pseudomonadales bacterium]|jgi:alcohol dehydrogenase (cytochrome c)/quinohemoprotein ethanol dehydrogenase|nr:PQQ-dependent dehydrogenase, methanol/ethanol family [Pseudomonadales bacterium]
MPISIKTVCSASTLALIAALSGCSGESPDSAARATATAAAPKATASSGDEWLSYGRDYSEQRYSPLKQINADNVEQLNLAWFGDLAERGGSYEATPLMANGRLFVSTPWSKVYAFDARSGQQLWKYDPKVPGEWAVKLCCGIVNRGVAMFEDTIIWATLDGRLVSVKADTGALVWEKQITDREGYHSITGAPRIADGRIFIGEAGSEYHQRGYMAAYDARNGNELWRWWAVPGNPALGFEQPELEMAAATWNGEWWKTGGGGTPWDGVTYDPVTKLVYIGTGNGAPWPADIRSPGGGDNLFTSSIVALDAATGAYRWHYQAVPRDSWDFDNTQQLVTADLLIDGTQRHVVMQAPKNGVFYVLDAATGKPLSADLFVPTANWLTGFDENFRPLINPDANYGQFGDKGFYVVPSYAGAHGWNPMAFNPDTGLMYIPTSYGSFPFVAEAGAKMGNQLLSINTSKRPEGPPPVLQGEGSYLLAWDPVQRKPLWEQRSSSSRTGVLTTAGNLVFQAAGNIFRAFRADTGEEVWSTNTQSGAVGGAISYALDGQQYIATVSGQANGGGGYWAPNYARLLVYKLGGSATLPEPVSYSPPVLNPPANFGDAALLAQGEARYLEHCSSCHGTSVGRVSSLFPDLRYAAALNAEAPFKAIVIDGALQNNGMVSFAQYLTPQDAEAIRAYVVSLANAARNPTPPPAPAAQVH